MGLFLVFSSFLSCSAAHNLEKLPPKHVPIDSPMGQDAGSLCSTVLVPLCMLPLLPQTPQSEGGEVHAAQFLLTCVSDDLGFPACIRSSEAPGARFQKAFHF